MVEYIGKYSFVEDIFEGSPMNDVFRCGRGPVLIQGGSGIDVAYVDYISSSIISGADYGNGRMHFRVKSDNYVDNFYELEFFDVEKVVFADGRKFKAKASTKSPKPLSVLLGQYNFIEDELTGGPLSTHFAPGSGDAIVNGGSEFDVLCVPVTEKSASWKADSEGNGVICFADENGDGNHQIQFYGMERIEFNDSVRERSPKSQQKFKKVRYSRLQ